MRSGAVSSARMIRASQPPSPRREADEGAFADTERWRARLGNDRHFFFIGSIADDGSAMELAIDIDRCRSR